MIELLNDIQKKYISLLTNEYQSHNYLCDRILLPKNERESFLRTLVELTAIESVNRKGDFGMPNYFVRLRSIKIAVPKPKQKENNASPKIINDWLDKPINRNIIFPILIGLFLVFVAALIAVYFKND